jgi:hypothetical protein
VVRSGRFGKNATTIQQDINIARTICDRQYTGLSKVFPKQCGVGLEIVPLNKPRHRFFRAEGVTMTDKERFAMFKPFRKTLLDEFNIVASAATDAEEEVLSANKYWKASDTLNRLLINIRRSKDRVLKAYNECCKAVENQEMAEQTKEVPKPKPREVCSDQLERLDRREEVLNPDPFDKGNWNKF